MTERSVRARRRLSAATMLVVVAAPPVLAHDVGITNARLLELAPGRYMLEADSSPGEVAALRSPVVPERFTTVERPTYRPLGIGLVVGWEFGGSDTPLAPGDALLLPWNRPTVLLSAHWLDGSVHRAMLPRGPAGIHVPIEALRPVERSRLEVAVRQAASGFSRLATSAAPALLALGLGLAIGGRRSVRLALAFAGGHALCLVLLDGGVPTLPPAAAAAALGVGIAILARSALRQDGAPLGPLLIAVGIVDGLGLAGGLRRGGPVAADLVPSVFGAAAGTDVVLVGAVALLAGLRAAVRRPRRVDVAATVLGSLAIAAAFGSAYEGLTAAPGTGLDPIDRVAAARLDLGGTGPMGSGAAAGPRTAAPPRRLEGPAMVFLTIEPTEVRVEVLLNLLDFLEPLRIEGDSASVVAADAQEAISARARKMVAGSLDVVIDERTAVPILERTDFVRVAATGVSTRVEPEAEPLATAVLGVTQVFGVDRPPSAVSVQWRAFPATRAVVPAVWTDPTRSKRTMLTAANPVMTWAADRTRVLTPPVRAVPVRRPRWPLASLGLTALAVFLGRSDARPRRALAWTGVVVAIALYPFVRHPIPLLGGFGGTPRPAETAALIDDLLTNVYRSFGLRDEGAIYDQLAVCVAGDHLSDIYLENRRALELENRGGARARVEDVEILDVRSVRRSAEGGVSVEAAWTVSGSVNHFGHVHYRQNRYDATIHLLAVDGVWKIREIELLDERRVL